jgi:hypothetical protein
MPLRLANLRAGLDEMEYMVGPCTHLSKTSHERARLQGGIDQGCLIDVVDDDDDDDVDG